MRNVQHRLGGRFGHVQALAITPDGSIGVIAEANSGLRIWNLNDNREVNTIETSEAGGYNQVDRDMGKAVCPNGSSCNSFMEYEVIRCNGPSTPWSSLLPRLRRGC